MEHIVKHKHTTFFADHVVTVDPFTKNNFYDISEYVNRGNWNITSCRYIPKDKINQLNADLILASVLKLIKEEALAKKEEAQQLSDVFGSIGWHGPSELTLEKYVRHYAKNSLVKPICDAISTFMQDNNITFENHNVEHISIFKRICGYIAERELIYFDPHLYFDNRKAYLTTPIVQPFKWIHLSIAGVEQSSIDSEKWKQVGQLNCEFGITGIFKERWLHGRRSEDMMQGELYDLLQEQTNNDNWQTELISHKKYDIGISEDGVCFETYRANCKSPVYGITDQYGYLLEMLVRLDQ